MPAERRRAAALDRRDNESLRPSTCISLAPIGVIAELFRYASDQFVQS
jgi:hypothetical protein